MSLAPLIPDPALADYWLSALAKVVDECRKPGAIVTPEDERLCNEYWARVARSPLLRSIRATRPSMSSPNYLDGDYEMIGTRQASEWGE